MKYNPGKIAQLLNQPLLLLSLTALVAYWGVWQLGLTTDDYWHTAQYTYQNPGTLLGLVEYNRAPLTLLLLYPALLALPLWLSHILVIAFQVIVSWLLVTLLQRLGLSHPIALATGLLFLVWNSQIETLFWLTTCGSVVSVGFYLGALHHILSHRYWPSVVCMCLGFLNYSEANILPALLFYFLLLHFKSVSWKKQMLYLGAAVIFYGLFQVARRVLTVEKDISGYKVGIGNLQSNLRQFILQQTTLASSYDLNPGQPDSGMVYTGLLLDYLWLFPAFILAGLVTWLIFRPSKIIIQATPVPSLELPRLSVWFWVSLLGWGASVLVFLVITNNGMQTRYTYTPTLFLSLLVVLTLYWLSHQIRSRWLIFIGLVGLIGWSFFLNWSSIQRNWIPARVANEKMLSDIKSAVSQNGINHVYIVNSVSYVGNAYTMANIITGLRSAGILALGQDSNLVNLDDLLWSPPAPGTIFDQNACLFIGWDDGKPLTASQVAVPAANLLLDCSGGKGQVQPLAATSPASLVHNLYSSVSPATNLQNLSKLGIHS